MTENFDDNLTKDASKFENVLTDEIKNQLKQIREIYTKINEKYDVIVQKINDKNDFSVTDKQKVLFFLTESQKIPFNNLLDEQLLSIMYNYNLTGEYMDYLFKILNKLFI